MTDITINHITPIESDGCNEITSDYGFRISPTIGVEKFHGGIDVAAINGTAIRATAAGKVIWIGSNIYQIDNGDGTTRDGGMGNAVVLEHEDGSHSTLYAHMESYANLNLGDTVNQGDTLGYVGNTGGSTGNHLHYGVYDAEATNDIKTSSKGIPNTEGYANIGVAQAGINNINPEQILSQYYNDGKEICANISDYTNGQLPTQELLDLIGFSNASEAVIEQFSEYEVVAGDTFNEIADRLIADGVIGSIQDLIDINPDLIDFDNLSIGQLLNVPTGEELSLGEAALDYLKDFGTGIVNGISETIASARNSLASLLERLRKDPLVLDLDGDGIALTSAENSTVFFDIDGDGDLDKTGWIDGAGDDAFLVVDKNENGNVDDVSELFGNDSETGFEELSKYDSNIDGVINSSDTQFNLLKVWDDENNNAVVDAGELTSLADNGIDLINRIYKMECIEKVA